MRNAARPSAPFAGSSGRARPIVSRPRCPPRRSSSSMDIRRRSSISIEGRHRSCRLLVSRRRQVRIRRAIEGPGPPRSKAGLPLGPRSRVLLRGPVRGSHRANQRIWSPRSADPARGLAAVSQERLGGGTGADPVPTPAVPELRRAVSTVAREISPIQGAVPGSSTGLLPQSSSVALGRAQVAGLEAFANSSRAQGGSDSRIRVSLERRVLSFTLGFFLSCIREDFLLRQLRVLDIQDDGVGVTVSWPAVRLEPREQLAVFRQSLRFGY